MVSLQTLEACWERHRNAVQLLYDGLGKMGLKLFVKDPVGWVGQAEVSTCCAISINMCVVTFVIVVIDRRMKSQIVI